MSAPVYGPATERVYSRLPEFYRDADAEQVPEYPLKKFVSANTAALDDANELVDRLDPDIGGTSDLVDPMTADLAWLPWLAQLVGVKLWPDSTPDEARDAVLYASSGFMAGTKKAMLDAAKSALTDTKHASIFDHRTTTGPGSVWDVLLVTRTSETPSVDAVRKAVIERGAKPAGVVMHFAAYSTSWDVIEANRPTWADWEAAGSWTALEETGLF